MGARDGAQGEAAVEAVERFVEMARAAGTEVVGAADDGVTGESAGSAGAAGSTGSGGSRESETELGIAGVVDALIADRFRDAANIASLVPGVAAANVDLAAIDDPHALADLDLVVLEGVLGVAENGAVWLPASRLGHRAAPFIAQHVLIVLDPRRIVADMHEAYTRIDPAGDGFGLFMAGPSKTADIEQSLVIGAHGPRSLTVLLATEKG